MTMTIGEVIAALETAKQDATVCFGFGYVYPTTVRSWRGIYAEAALGFEGGDYGSGHPKVSEVLAELRQSIDGRTYEGWKGGTYKYDKDTPLHVDNRGNSSDTDIIAVRVRDWQVVILTQYNED
jgi:hypothetical protein